MVESRARRSLLLLLAVSAGAGALASSQAPSGALSRPLHSDDWAISDWSSIRAGQLSVIHRQNTDELQVNALTTRDRPAPAGADRGAVPACDGNCFLVSAFDFGNANRLGGFFGTFGTGTSTARAALDGGADGRRALTIDFSNTASGASGTWIHLFDSTLPPSARVYLDTTPMQMVSFWIRGQSGGEVVMLKAADAAWERKEDTLPVGDVGSFLAAGRITTAWELAVVPLSAFPPRLDRHTLALLAFESGSKETARVAIKNLAFCLRPDPVIALSPPAAPLSGLPPRDRALWVWNTTAIVRSPAEQRALVDFARRGGFTQLFLQLPDAVPARKPSGRIELDSSGWQPFLGLLNGNGLRAHALLGSPDDALPERRQRVLATVEAVLAYNAAAAARERFAGLHYDIEPYLLPAFRGARRQSLLTGYLDLVAETAARAKAAGIEFGVDIPFWYDSLDDLTGELPLVEYRGARKPASEHILDLVDTVTVMTYRTAAYGADSIAALADGELAYASLRGKRVFVGLETTDLPDEDLIEFGGEPGRGLPASAPAGRTVVIEAGAGTTTVWVAPRAAWGEFRATLGAGQPGAPAGPFLCWPVLREVAVPAGKLTFARLGAARLDAVLRQVLPELMRHPSFRGFAIHDYVGYSALLRRTRPPA